MRYKEQNQKDHAMDKLISGILKDDLPPAVESRMQGQLLRFQDQLAAKPSLSWYQGILPKAALAAGAVLMVVLGGFLQAKGPQTILTENLSLVGTSLHVSNQVGSSTSMLCSAKIQRESGEVREYVVRSLSSGHKRVDILTEEQHVAVTVWIKAGVIIVADFTKGSIQEFSTLDQIVDPFLQPLLALLSPENLSEVLHGQWQLTSRQQEGSCEWKTYAITPLEHKDSMMMTVDFCSYLPVEVQKTTTYPFKSIRGEEAELKISFQWNAPIQPQVMDPSAEKMKKNV